MAEQGERGGELFVLEEEVVEGSGRGNGGREF